MTINERPELIDSLIEGSISEADFLRIEAEMSVNDEVRQEYYQRLKLHLLLERESNAIDLQSFVADVEPQAASLPARWRAADLLGLLLTLAAAIFASVALLPVMTNDTSSSNRAQSTTESTALGFGLLGGQVEAVWAGAPLESGRLIPAGKLHLQSGMVQLELFSGVQMVIQGDAVFSVDSAMEVALQRGRARAFVPDAAHGFRVKTQQGEVVDLGTEFAIEAGPDRSRVDVVTGEVELHAAGVDHQLMVEGDSFELTAAGKTRHVDLEKINVIGPTEFLDRLSTTQSSRFRRWQEHAAAMQRDPQLIAYYQFDSSNVNSRRLENLAATATGNVGDGAIVACERTRDRWGHVDGALGFSPMGSRVRVDIPGEYRNVTMLCWVKFNDLNRLYNSLFLTDGHELNEPHWQITNDGRLFFSVKKSDNRLSSSSPTSKFDAYSPVIWTPSMSGQWTMLATVYDVDTQQITHFVNGKPVSQESVPDDLLVERVKIGPSSIGNWSEPMYRTDPEFVIRNINGSMDEFAIFSKALTPAEIADHYQQGVPN